MTALFVGGLVVFAGVIIGLRRLYRGGWAPCPDCRGAGDLEGLWCARCAGVGFVPKEEL